MPAISGALSLLRADVELLAGRVAAQAEAEAERTLKAEAERDETRAALAAVEDAVVNIAAKSYDEQLLALQVRVSLTPDGFDAHPTHSPWLSSGYGQVITNPCNPGLLV